jgi:hypothetical protein
MVPVIEGQSASATTRSVGVSSSVASVSGNGGGSLTMTASAPVAAAGTISQTITQTFDPTRLNLTGATGIVAPAGWTLTYSSDGSTFGTAPTSSQGWAAVRAVRATGSITSAGDSNGLQIASGAATGSVPASQAFSSAGGGDGWDVAFDERGHVFNTFHHDGYWGQIGSVPGFNTPQLDCHTRTGGSCGPGWPFLLRIPYGTTGPDGVSGQPWYHTNQQSMQWVDVINNRVWISTAMNDGNASRTGIGFVCVDVADMAVGPAWCGGDIHDAFVRLSPSACGRDCALGFAAVAGRLFAWDALTGKLMCMDPFGTRAGNLPGTACASQPFSFTSITSAGLGDGYSLMAANGLVWGTAGGASASRAICFDPEALALCSGWSSVGSVAISGTNPNMSFEVPTANGLVGAVCFTRYDTVRACYLPDGTSSTELSGSHAGSALMAFVSGKVTSTIEPKYAMTSGTRTYWADGSWPGGGRIHCWDASLASGAGAVCPNWPVNVSAYTATVDSQNPNCIWTNTDSGAITQIDAVTGASSCTTPPPIAEFSAPVMLPRIACTSASSIQSWRNFKLTAPAASTYSTALLTVLTATGRVVAGWNRVSIPAGSRTVDLSGLSVAASGLSPRFRVILNDKTTTDPIAAEVSAVGNSPELCVPLQTAVSCPSSPSKITGAMPTPTAIVVTGSGTAQPSSGPAEEFTSGFASVQVSAATDANCLGTISGTTAMQTTSVVVAGAVVRLVNASGAAIATTTTDSSGNYTFDRLAAGSGYRVEFGPTSQGSANAATVSSESVDRLVTANAMTTVNGVYGVLRTNALSASTAHGEPVMLQPAPHDSSNVQTYASFTRSATCVVDPTDRVCKASVLIAGEGTWSTDSASGDLRFSPLVGFSGATTAVTYRVTETSSSWTTTNTAQVTVAVATTTTSTTTAPPSTASSTTASSAVPTTTSSVPQSTPTTSIPTAVAIQANSSIRAASTGVVSSRVYAPSPGVIRQTATMAKSLKTICSSRPTVVTAAGTVSTRCLLTSAALKLLKRGSVSVTVVTRFRGTDGSVRVTRTRMTLRRASRLPATLALRPPMVAE